MPEPEERLSQDAALNALAELKEEAQAAHDDDPARIADQVAQKLLHELAAAERKMQAEDNHRGTPMRAKTWDERGDADKLDLLRGEVRSLRLETTDLRELVFQLLQHRHDLSGDLLVKLNGAGGGGLGRFNPGNYDPLA